jgi:hypothetical protein
MTLGRGLSLATILWIHRQRIIPVDRKPIQKRPYALSCSLGNWRPRCASRIDSLYKLTVLYDRDAVY